MVTQLLPLEPLIADSAFSTSTPLLEMAPNPSDAINMCAPIGESAASVVRKEKETNINTKQQR